MAQYRSDIRHRAHPIPIAQGLVANLFGGLTIYASRPFTVGEWVIMAGTEVMGEVQQIGWRATRVMDFDRRPFYVLNSLFNTAVLANHSRMTARRIQEHLHLRYRDIDKVQAIVTDTNRMLSEHPGIQHGFFIFRFDTCGDFALKLFLYAFTAGTDYTEYMSTKEDILLKIAAIVRDHGASLLFRPRLSTRPTWSSFTQSRIRRRPIPSLKAFDPEVQDRLSWAAVGWSVPAIADFGAAKPIRRRDYCSRHS